MKENSLGQMTPESIYLLLVFRSFTNGIYFACKILGRWQLSNIVNAKVLHEFCACAIE